MSVPSPPPAVSPELPSRVSKLSALSNPNSVLVTELRRHFEIDAGNIVVAALHALERAGEMKAEHVKDAIEAAGIDPEAIDPRYA